MKRIIQLSVISIAFVAVYFYLFKPHITLKEVRISSELSEIKAVYVNITGDPLCAKLYRLERMKKDGKPVASDSPLFLSMPKGLFSPEDGGWAYSDNLFLIKGYGYKYEERNILTGNTKTFPSNRFDVIAWEVIAPYKTWNNDGGSGGSSVIKSITATTPIKHHIKSDDHAPDHFVKGNYIDCLR